MEARTPARTTERRITRRELEAVIRRAAELAAADADAAERISEDEVLRIASELGLPERHVRRAIFEMPAAPEDLSLLDRILGPHAADGMRVVPGESGSVFDRLEEYLTTREYLRVLRRQGGAALLEPSDDAISKMVRVFSRPAGRHHLARARRVRLSVNPLESGRSHVRLEVDLEEKRRSDALGGAAVGGLFGATVGGGLAFAAAGAVSGMAGDVAAISAAVLTFGGTLTASVSAGLAVARARFHRRLAAARLEIEGLLDRVEAGDRLEPPPAPWRRRLTAGLSQRSITGR